MRDWLDREDGPGECAAYFLSRAREAGGVFEDVDGEAQADIVLSVLTSLILSFVLTFFQFGFIFPYMRGTRRD